MRTSIIRLTHLVSQLLQLSHLENPLSRRNLEKVDFEQLCRQVVETFKLRADVNQQKLQLVFSGGDNRVMGSAPMLVSLVSNLAPGKMMRSDNMPFNSPGISNSHTDPPF